MTTEKKKTPAATPRRRFTPEEQIVNRLAEVERIRTRQRAAVLKMLEEARELLGAIASKADAIGMRAEADQCVEALGAISNLDGTELEGELLPAKDAEVGQ
jgi:hypothetical protein